MSPSPVNGNQSDPSDPCQASLAQALRQADAYPSCSPASPIVLHETHVSWVFLAGQYAYKVKKPIKTGFLDYGSLAKRKHCCHQEYRLNRRYAPDLYLGVVPITCEQGSIRVEGSGDPIEFAVKMQRFPEDALLSQRLATGKIANDEVFQLAATVAQFHQGAAHCDPHQPWGSPSLILKEAIDNFRDLDSALAANPADVSSRERLQQLRTWTELAYQRLHSAFDQRRENGHIRECHGDLHLANVIRWRGRWTPFDGIEFNEEFRWIDVLSDAAFLAMDFAAQDHLDLARSFVNAYLEQTGDYQALPLLRWYLVYRAMVRAKVAAIRWQQPGQSQTARATEWRESLDHVKLAARLAESLQPRLWITYGVSGSGKTTGSEYLVQRDGVIRLRSDVERKRQFGLAASQRPQGSLQQQLYSSQASEQTYHRLQELARTLLQAGESVVVDATFLRRPDRNRFRELAIEQGVPFAILSFSEPREELERRIALRLERDQDASDANPAVLRSQLETMEPLSDDELRLVQRPSVKPSPD